MSEIAAFARVKRPVVSTWRRRHRDFPAAVSQNSGRPLFNGAQVADWLITSGLGNAAPAELRSELALFGIVALRDRFTPWQLVETLGSLLCLRRLDGRPLTDGTNGSPDEAEADGTLWSAVLHRAERIDAEDDFVLRELSSLDATAAPLVRLAEDLVEAAYDEHGAYEWLLAARSRLGLDSLAADAAVPELRRLLTQLTDLRFRLEHGESLTLADPHARAGDLLAALLDDTRGRATGVTRPRSRSRRAAKADASPAAASSLARSTNSTSTSRPAPTGGTPADPASSPPSSTLSTRRHAPSCRRRSSGSEPGPIRPCWASDASRTAGHRDVPGRTLAPSRSRHRPPRRHVPPG
ncbi:hypothetical protein SFUMM280S_08377 [Streptomyces fumanus]